MIKDQSLVQSKVKKLAKTKKNKPITLVERIYFSKIPKTNVKS